MPGPKCIDGSPGRSHDTLVLLARQQRLTLNDLISGLLQKMLQPPPDDTETVSRRLERVERAVQHLSTSIQGLEQHLQSTAETMQGDVGEVRSAVHYLAQEQRTLVQTVENILAGQYTRLGHIVQDLLKQEAQERSGVYAKVRVFVARALTEPPHGR
ncbi:MAG: hypothetical protein AB7N91_31075 [Candidatus Tectimicrobiota bacterium]